MSETNIDKYDKVFMDSFDVSKDQLTDKLVYNSIDTWDSIGHMGMIDELEGTFDITFEADDIIDFSSYEKGKEILSKYGVSLS